MVCCHDNDEGATTLNSSGYRGPNPEMHSQRCFRRTLVRSGYCSKPRRRMQGYAHSVGATPFVFVTPQPIRSCDLRSRLSRERGAHVRLSGLLSLISRVLRHHDFARRACAKNISVCEHESQNGRLFRLLIPFWNFRVFCSADESGSSKSPVS
jgi:hypothetical protein